MAGAPWFGAVCGNGETWRQTVQFLKDVLDSDAILETFADSGFEFVMDVSADDEDKFVEAGA